MVGCLYRERRMLLVDYMMCPFIDPMLLELRVGVTFYPSVGNL